MKPNGLNALRNVLFGDRCSCNGHHQDGNIKFGTNLTPEPRQSLAKSLRIGVLRIKLKSGISSTPEVRESIVSRSGQTGDYRL